MVVRSHEMFINIPKPYTPNYDVKISSVSIKDDILKAEFSLPVTEKVGQFELEVDNNGEDYSDSYTGGEAVLIYLDNDQGDTLKFTGYVEKVKKKCGDKGFIMKIEGSHVAGKLLEITVTESYDSQELSVILKDLITNYATDFSYDDADIIASSTSVTLNFSNKPFWEVIVDLCNIGDYDCYVDNDSKFHFFPKNSVDCDDDAIVFGDNHLETVGLGDDTVAIKNKVIVYGDSDSETPVIYTTEDSGSQSTYHLKETIIRDNSISTYEEAKDRGDAELTRQKNIATKGKSESLALYYVNPGEMMWISIMPQSIHARYRVTNVIQTIDSGYCTTECEVEEPIHDVPRYFQQRLSKEIALEDINNPNTMEYSYNFPFNSEDNIATLNNMEVAEGYLRVTVGNTTGSMFSTARMASVDITSIELRAVGEGLAGAIFYYSTDNGLSWERIEVREVKTPTVSGKNLMLKIDVSSASVSIDDCVLLYK